MTGIFTYNVKAPGQVRCLGFEVSGVPPSGFHEAPVADLFELREAAIECAVQLQRDGWRNVVCAELKKDNILSWREPISLPCHKPAMEG